MDEQLRDYIGTPAQTPPVVCEREIVAELARREKRLHLILLSVAGLLWTALLYCFAFMVGLKNRDAGVAMLVAISVGCTCAGCFAGLVMKFRKVEW